MTRARRRIEALAQSDADEAVPYRRAAKLLALPQKEGMVKLSFVTPVMSNSLNVYQPQLRGLHLRSPAYLDNSLFDLLKGQVTIDRVAE